MSRSQSRVVETPRMHLSIAKIFSASIVSGEWWDTCYGFSLVPSSSRKCLANLVSVSRSQAPFFSMLLVHSTEYKPITMIAAPITLCEITKRITVNYQYIQLFSNPIWSVQVQNSLPSSIELITKENCCQDGYHDSLQWLEDSNEQRASLIYAPNLKGPGKTRGHNTLDLNDMCRSYDASTYTDLLFVYYPIFQCQKTVPLCSYKIDDLDFPSFTYSPIYMFPKS